MFFKKKQEVKNRKSSPNILDARYRKIESVLDIWEQEPEGAHMVRLHVGSQMNNENDNIFDFTKILKAEDIHRGLKRLAKKKKYKDPYDTDSLLRYLKKDKKPNKLKYFIDEFKVGKNINEKISEYYSGLKSYRLDPYSAYSIPKPGKPGKFRPLLVPEPKDRLLFDSLLPIITEELKPFLIKRGLLGLGLLKRQRISDIVINIYKNYIKAGYHHVLILDFNSFFSLIDRNILIKRLKKDGIDRNIINAIKHTINNKISNGLVVEQKTGVPITQNGIPQGLSFSPLLACYYALDIDDVYIKYDNVSGFRYIDDIVILGKNPADLVTVFNLIKEEADILKMELHPLGGKSQLKCLYDDSFTYLGVNISFNGLEIDEKKFDEFKKIIKNDIFPTIALNRKPYADIKGVYFNFISGWLNHYESIVQDKRILHKKLNSLIKECFFEKNRSKRMPFYRANKEWILMKTINQKRISGA